MLADTSNFSCVDLAGPTWMHCQPVTLLRKQPKVGSYKVEKLQITVPRQSAALKKMLFE